VERLRAELCGEFRGESNVMQPPASGESVRARTAAIRPLRIGALELERNVILAPMAGVTNLPFRLIAREAGAGLVFTETVSAKGLVSGGKKSWRLVESSPREEPLGYQLFGNDVGILGEATRQLVDRGASFIDLNLGCPVKKFLKHGAGACLLREPKVVGPLVASMRKAIPRGVLSIKVRLGWDSSSITAPEVARIAEAEGIDFMTVHGRTRAQLYSGHADRGRIAEVVRSVSIPVFANGDVVAAQDALDMLEETGAAGVMIGRGAMNNPWIFSHVVELAQGRPVPRPSAGERAALVERHVQLMIDYFEDEHSTLHNLKKYLAAYSTGMGGASEFRDGINRALRLDAAVDEARRFFGSAASEARSERPHGALA
jgi:tRNA-dihydrouridine synthase B